ncbi:uncharacterized protein LOC118181830 [Stegodyphus dumicola]|uniref:uncharacterized protein LOC118181830 n=1 Tax=Stegodyphus dumicola TaxID=202533 RepID=UPI0015A9E597|nr:uncharacterized protein LOC118181830 [Stegodyphus dumicola]
MTALCLDKDQYPLRDIINISVVRSHLQHTWLLKALRILEINVQMKNTSKWCLKQHIQPACIYLHLIFFHILLLLTVAREISKSIVSGIICNCLSLYLWYIIKLRSKFLCRLLHNLNDLSYSIAGHNFLRYKLINVSLFVVFVIPLIFSVQLITFHYYGRYLDHIQFWLMGHSLPSNQILEKTLIFISAALYYSVHIVPCIFVVTYSVLCCILNKIILFHFRKIKVTSKDLIHQLKSYNAILNCCKLFEKCYSFPLLLDLCYFLMTTFTALTLALGYASFSRHIRIQESILILLVSAISIFSIFVCASKIPESLENVKARYQYIYRILSIENCQGKLYEKNILRLLKILCEIETVHLTVYNVIRVNRNLMLSTVGCILTYSLLVLQLQLNDK